LVGGICGGGGIYYTVGDNFLFNKCSVTSGSTLTIGGGGGYYGHSGGICGGITTNNNNVPSIYGNSGIYTFNSCAIMSASDLDIIGAVFSYYNNVPVISGCGGIFGGINSIS
jgi:hypothetical protein